jgi:glycosyltransferase involved in cell wall biosynthesis
MHPISVVIITKNEAANIENAILSAKTISEDIVVVDSGSTDETIAIAKRNGAAVVKVQWTNFGAVRNIGAAAAKHDWIFALDADERISPELSDSISQLSPDMNVVYGCKRLNFLYGEPVYHGEWGRDTTWRFYDKTKISWKEVAVHETLEIGDAIKKILPGRLLHFTMKDEKEFAEKTERYAKLNAEKYKDKNKNVSGFKLLLSPAFGFVQNYIFRLGFLDGKAGFTVAKMNARYTFLKYKFLRQLKQQHKN